MAKVTLVPCSVNLTGKRDTVGHGEVTINNARIITDICTFSCHQIHIDGHSDLAPPMYFPGYPFFKWPTEDQVQLLMQRNDAFIQVHVKLDFHCLNIQEFDIEYITNLLLNTMKAQGIDSLYMCLKCL